MKNACTRHAYNRLGKKLQIAKEHMLALSHVAIYSAIQTFLVESKWLLQNCGSINNFHLMRAGLQDPS